MMLAPTRVIDELIQQGVTARYFHHPAHEIVFDTLIEMREAGRPVDLVSVTQHLEDKALLEQVGGAAGVTELFTFTPSAASVFEYLETLRDKFLRRELILASIKNQVRAYDFEESIDLITAEAEARIMGIGEGAQTTKEKTMVELVTDATEALERVLKQRGAVTGVPTGFKGIDQMTDGLHPGEMFVIAARPSMGKTALAMNISENVSIDTGKPVGVYSLEMSSGQLVQRLICSRARVDMKKFHEGFIDRQALNRIIFAGDEIARAKMTINDKAGMTIMQLRADARRLKTRKDIQLIVIDYLQLLRSPSKRGSENRQVEVAEISSGIKALAKELHIPVIVLAQLNRSPEARGGDAKGRPKLSDLRESGSIEQDADVVGLLYREDYYATNDAERKELEGKATLIIAKQRNGSVGDIPLTFVRQLTRFEDRALSVVDAINP